MRPGCSRASSAIFEADGLWLGTATGAKAEEAPAGRIDRLAALREGKGGSVGNDRGSMEPTGEDAISWHGCSCES